MVEKLQQKRYNLVLLISVGIVVTFITLIVSELLLEMLW